MRKHIFVAAAVVVLALLSFAVFPSHTYLFADTQIYALRYPGLLTLQTHWLALNKDKFNIRYVLSLGDVTDKNTAPEWRHAQEAFAELDGHIPYVLLAGNHDYASSADVAPGQTGLNKYFPASKFRGSRGSSPTPS